MVLKVGRATGVATAALMVLPLVSACTGGSSTSSASSAACATLPSPTMSISLKSIHVNVWNADGDSGQASTVAEQLKWRGIQIISTGNDPESDSIKAPTYAEIRYGSNGRQIALTLAKQVKDAKLRQDDRTDPSVDLVLGSKFALIPVAAPKASSVTVNVYNAYVLPGSASELAADLRKRGFKVKSVGNDPDSGYYPDNAVAIRYGAQGEPAARRAKAQFSNVKMVQDKRSGSTIDVVIGSKWTDSSLKSVAKSTIAATSTSTAKASSSASGSAGC